MTTKEYALSRKNELTAYVMVMRQYLEAKKLINDWHGVRDAVVDIEVAEAKISAFDEILKL